MVGSQARILYADAQGRVRIALALNRAVRSGALRGPVVLSRDHHDVSGTDSPYRETSSVYDGSMFTADMAVQNFVGDSFRGATWVALHNGGGVGWGEVMNGGFGLVLDGSEDADRRARDMLSWDVINGVARRAWAGNANAKIAIGHAMELDPRLRVTEFIHASDDVIEEGCRESVDKDAGSAAAASEDSAAPAPSGKRIRKRKKLPGEDSDSERKAPPKPQSPPAPEPAAAPSADGSAQQPKRSRGRPRKYPVRPAPDPQAPKRKRGRPRKEKAAGEKA